LPSALLSSLLTVSTARGLVFSSLFEYGWQHMALLHLYSLPLVQCSQPVKLLTSQRPQCHRVARSRDGLYSSVHDAKRQFIAMCWCIHVTTERHLFTVLLTACLLEKYLWFLELLSVSCCKEYLQRHIWWISMEGWQEAAVVFRRGIQTLYWTDWEKPQGTPARQGGP
jgi:hypothetical protein